MGDQKGRDYLKNNKPAKATQKMMSFWKEQAYAKDKAAKK